MFAPYLFKIIKSCRIKLGGLIIIMRNLKKIIKVLLAMAATFAIGFMCFSCKKNVAVNEVETSEVAAVSTDEMQVIRSADEQIKMSDISVERDAKFGCVNIHKTLEDFANDGFELGDSVDVKFSNGYEISDIPYYDGFYANAGDLLVVAYPSNPWVAVIENNGNALWDYANLESTDTVTIELREKGKYKNIQDSLNLGKYTSDRNDYTSDEIFCNFRNVVVGNLKRNILYRGASPIDNLHGRAKYVDKLIKDVGITYDIDLSDSDENIKNSLASDDFDSEYFKSLYDAGNVTMLDMNVNFKSETFAKKVVKAMTDMARSDGPNYVHCVEGKDRTGFVMMVAEGLAGATYDEIVSDYMITYANYYGVTESNNKEKYDAIKSVYIDGMLRIVATLVDSGNESIALSDIDWTGVMGKYLNSNGMTMDDIDAWYKKFTRS